MFVLHLIKAGKSLLRKKNTLLRVSMCVYRLAHLLHNIISARCKFRYPRPSSVLRRLTEVDNVARQEKECTSTKKREPRVSCTPKHYSLRDQECRHALQRWNRTGTSELMWVQSLCDLNGSLALAPQSPCDDKGILYDGGVSRNSKGPWQTIIKEATSTDLVQFRLCLFIAYNGV